MLRSMPVRHLLPRRGGKLPMCSCDVLWDSKVKLKTRSKFLSSPATVRVLGKLLPKLVLHKRWQTAQHQAAGVQVQVIGMVCSPG